MEKGKRPQTKEQRQKQVITRLKNENSKLRIEFKVAVAKLESENKDLREKLEKAMLFIEQLQKIVFRGKKKHDKDNEYDDDDENNSNTPNNGHQNRSKSSYRRQIPKEDEITDEEEHHIENCPDCGSALTMQKVLEFFIEDILPIFEWYQNLKKITKLKITTGYCPKCQKRVSAIPIPKQKVSLGNNIKQLIVFQTTIQQLSYSQIIDFTQSCLQFNLSKGEIINILERQANKLKPAFEDLKQSIRGAPGVHIDETSWLTINGGQGDFAWTMASANSTDVLYLLGRNRGKGNAQELIGEDFKNIGITDGYGAYKNIFKKGKHALCWAHPQRTLKDLKNSKYLTSEKKQSCKTAYQKFSLLYEEVRKTWALPFNEQQRLKEKERLMKIFEEIMKPNQNDPTKLKTVKETMKKDIEKYFVCIANPNIPPDNNKAERSLRHLVIKRKKSFGSKTQKGADIMSVLYSVVMSLWNRGKENFFENYERALSEKSLNFGGQ